jgi:hypothetical protein
MQQILEGDFEHDRKLTFHKLEEVRIQFDVNAIMQ